MNMVHYISQSCRNNLSLGESYSSWLTRVTRAVRWKMNARALPNSQSTALWRGEAETGSNRYFLDGTFLFTGLLGTQMSQNCWMLPVLPIPQVQVQWHRHNRVYKLAGQLPAKDPSNATRRKCEGKIEDPSFTCPLVIMVLFALRSQTLWQHRWEAVHRFCRTCYSPHWSLTQGRRTSVPTLPCIPVTRGTSAMTEGLSSSWKRT